MSSLKIGIVLLVCIIFSQAQAYERLALVIGINNYQPIKKEGIVFDQLDKAVNDARAIRNILRDLGFAVIYLEDADKRQIDEAINLFGNNLQKETVGLFYFAGHAIQNKGHNYLIPTSMPNIYDATKIEKEAISLSQILESMKEANNNINLVILDACRNDPELQIAQLPEHTRKGITERAFRGDTISKGLSKVTNTLVPPDRLLIAYATAANSFAREPPPESLSEKHGYYTKYLLKNLDKQGYSLRRILDEVSKEVVLETNGIQTPWYETAMKTDFYPAGRERMTTDRIF